MSRLCAKPTCSEPSVRWFEIAAAQRRVIVRHEETPLSIGLCEAHAGRFSAPSGWEISRVGEASSEDELLEPTGEGVSAPHATPGPTSEGSRRRKHDRGTPWFLAGVDSSPDDERSEPLPSDRPFDPVQRVPSAGSLLHRAFHGPDRTADSEGETDQRSGLSEPGDASVEDEGEVGSERSIDDGYNVELPFPPFESTRHIAVS